MLKSAVLGAFGILFLFGTVHAEEHVDLLDLMLANVVAGKAKSPEFYDALLKTTLYVVVEPAESPADGAPKFVFSYRLKDERKIIDVYTSQEQVELSKPLASTKTIQMKGRELFESVVPTGCDIGVNSYSGHGGQFTAKKIQELLKT